MTGPPNFALLELGQDVMKWVFGGQILGFGELHKGKERNRLRDEIGDSSHAYEDEEAPLLFQNSALIDEEALVTKTLLPPGSDVLTSSISDSSYTNGPVFDSCAVQPLTFDKEMTALQVEGPEEEIASDLELPTLMDNIELNAASVNINNSPAEVNAYNKANEEHGEEGKTISDSVFLGESVREELYMFYEANESVTKSMASSSTLKSFSHHASVLNSNKYSSLMRNSAQVSLQTAGNAIDNIQKFIISMNGFSLSIKFLLRLAFLHVVADSPGFLTFLTVLTLYEGCLLIQNVCKENYLLQVIKKAFPTGEEILEKAMDFQETGRLDICLKIIMKIFLCSPTQVGCKLLTKSILQNNLVLTIDC